MLGCIVCETTFPIYFQLIIMSKILHIMCMCCVQEIGDFENWIKTMEYDCEKIAGTLRNVASSR